MKENREPKTEEKVVHKKLLNGHDPHFRNAYQRHEKHKQTNKNEVQKRFYFLLFFSVWGKQWNKVNERRHKKISKEQKKNVYKKYDELVLP